MIGNSAKKVAGDGGERADGILVQVGGVDAHGELVDGAIVTAVRERSAEAAARAKGIDTAPLSAAEGTSDHGAA